MNKKDVFREFSDLALSERFCQHPRGESLVPLAFVHPFPTNAPQSSVQGSLAKLGVPILNLSVGLQGF